MITTLIDGKQVPEFDGEIVRELKLKDGSAKAVKAERMILGIRNENREIYRAVGVTGLDNFLRAIEKLVKLGFIDELENANGPKGGYDAIFRR